MSEQCGARPDGVSPGGRPITAQDVAPEFRRIQQSKATVGEVADRLNRIARGDVPAPAVEPRDAEHPDWCDCQSTDRFVVGDVEMTAQAATGLRDALTAAITEAQR